jgi:hypothetical protein
MADMAWNITVCGNGLATAAPPDDPDLDSPAHPRLPDVTPPPTDFSFSFSFASFSPPFSWFDSS